MNDNVGYKIGQLMTFDSVEKAVGGEEVLGVQDPGGNVCNQKIESQENVRHNSKQVRSWQ